MSADSVHPASGLPESLGKKAHSSATASLPTCDSMSTFYNGASTATLEKSEKSVWKIFLFLDSVVGSSSELFQLFER